jgi:hypothetical protein
MKEIRLWDLPFALTGLRLRHVRLWNWSRLFTLMLALVGIVGLLWSCTLPVQP